MGWLRGVAVGLSVMALGTGCSGGRDAAVSPSSAPSRPPAITSGPTTPETSSATRSATSRPATSRPNPAPSSATPPSGSVSPSPPAPYVGQLTAALTGRIVTEMANSGKAVALTFDGGADARGAERIVQVLRERGVPASFFVTGKFAQANGPLVTQLASIGPVGNHTWDHPHSPGVQTPALVSQIERTAAVIAAQTGRSDRPFFRFPFGEYDSRTLRAVNSAGYAAIGWTVDSLGWQGTSGGMSVARVVRRVVGAAKPGAIVLMHLGGHPTDHSTLDADALGQIIDGYRAAGYQFVTLEALA